MVNTLRVLLAVTVVLRATAHMNFLQDEFLWTKATWSEFRLQADLMHAHSPADTHNSTFHLAATAVQSGLLSDRLASDLGVSWKHHEAISLMGALPLKTSDALHGHKLLLNTQTLDVLKSSASVPQAALLVQCAVCKALVQEIWRGLLEWLLSAPAKRLSRERLAAYVPELCSSEVPPRFLTQFVVLESEIYGKEGPLQHAENDLVFLERQNEAASVHELHAVRLACHMITWPLDAGGPPATKSDTQRQDTLFRGSPGAKDLERRNLVLDAVLDAVSSMVTQLEGISGVGYSADGGNAVILTRDVTDGPALEDACHDHNPRCDTWALQGECGANSRYMIGAGEWPGFCRVACGACTPAPHLRSTTLSKRTARLVVHQATQLSGELEQRICAKASPCQRAMEQRVLQSFRPAQSDSKQALSGHPPPDNERWQSTRVRFTRDISDIHPAVEPVKDAGGRPLHAAHVLNQHLGGKCIFSGAHWWMYELCWNAQLSQLHVKAERFELFSVIGVPAEASHQPDQQQQQLFLSEWELLEGLTGSTVPFVNISFTRGSPCMTAKGSKVLRSGEVHAACSPDTNHMHLIVTEPRRCHYVATLYVAPLCDVPGFMPKWLYNTDGHGHKI